MRIPLGIVSRLSLSRLGEYFPVLEIHKIRVVVSVDRRISVLTLESRTTEMEAGHGSVS